MNLSRRTLMSAPLIGAVTLLTGCGVRFENDADNSEDMPIGTNVASLQQAQTAFMQCAQAAEMASAQQTSRQEPNPGLANPQTTQKALKHAAALRKEQRKIVEGYLLQIHKSPENSSPSAAATSKRASRSPLTAWWESETYWINHISDLLGAGSKIGPSLWAMTATGIGLATITGAKMNWPLIKPGTADPQIASQTYERLLPIITSTENLAANSTGKNRETARGVLPLYYWLRTEMEANLPANFAASGTYEQLTRESPVLHLAKLSNELLDTVAQNSKTVKNSADLQLILETLVAAIAGKALWAGPDAIPVAPGFSLQ